MFVPSEVNRSQLGGTFYQKTLKTLSKIEKTVRAVLTIQMRLKLMKISFEILGRIRFEHLQEQMEDGKKDRRIRTKDFLRIFFAQSLGIEFCANTNVRFKAIKTEDR